MVALLSAVVAISGATPAAAANHGITLLSSERLDSRLVDLTLSTPALAKPTHVRVLLPAGYRKQKPRRYPVLYLLHGAFDDYRSWTDKGAVENITGRRKLIVVMPDGGQGGWYTNWVNRGQGGPPEWETFHIQQLIPWIDYRYRVNSSRRSRAIAGLSMGGFGAMSYAARHPDLFSWAGSFSGAVDIVNYPLVAVIINLEAPFDGGVAGDQFGDRTLDEVNWRAHNPWDLAANLRGMTLVIDTGNGQPGPLDPARQVLRRDRERRRDDERLVPPAPALARHPARLGRLRSRHPLLALLAARSARGASVDDGDSEAARRLIVCCFAGPALKPQFATYRCFTRTGGVPLP